MHLVSGFRELLSGFQVFGPTFTVSGLFYYELATQAEHWALRLTRRISGSGEKALVVVPVVVPASPNLT